MVFEQFKIARKAMSGKGAIMSLIGALVFIVMVVELGPTMFNGLNMTANGAPSWLAVALPLVIGAGILYAVWRLF